MERITVKNLIFTLYRSERRKTISIIVDRNGDVILRAPADCSLAEIEHVAQEQLLWAQTKLAEKRSLYRPPRPKSYVDGEGFYYLGQCYRLMLTDSIEQKPPLLLKGEWFMLRRDARPQAGTVFKEWYTAEARLWLPPRVQRFAPRVDVKPSGVTIRDLGFRWGSCSSSGKLNFHWQTMLLEPELIDYIVVHELVHLKLRRHSAAFWRLVERVIPNYQERQKWLTEKGRLAVDLGRN
jgi:predicted metal-dependent hydrolase